MTVVQPPTFGNGGSGNMDFCGQVSRPGHVARADSRNHTAQVPVPQNTAGFCTPAAAPVAVDPSPMNVRPTMSSPMFVTRDHAVDHPSIPVQISGRPAASPLLSSRNHPPSASPLPLPSNRQASVAVNSVAVNPTPVHGGSIAAAVSSRPMSTVDPSGQFTARATACSGQQDQDALMRARERLEREKSALEAEKSEMQQTMIKLRGDQVVLDKFTKRNEQLEREATECEKQIKDLRSEHARIKDDLCLEIQKLKQDLQAEKKRVASTKDARADVEQLQKENRDLQQVRTRLNFKLQQSEEHALRLAGLLAESGRDSSYAFYSKPGERGGVESSGTTYTTPYDVFVELESLTLMIKNKRVDVWEACPPVIEPSPEPAQFVGRLPAQFVASQLPRPNRTAQSIGDEALETARSTFDINKTTDYKIVAVIGIFDKGKTWLINRLFKRNLKSGPLCVTQGLSFLWLEEERILILDSAGTQATLSYKQAEDGRLSKLSTSERISDARSTEAFTYNVIAGIAHHVVFVVNDLTWYEQHQIKNLHQLFNENREKASSLVVVHNMKTVSMKVMAEEVFCAQISSRYEGLSNAVSKLRFDSSLGRGKNGEAMPKIHHIGLCQADSEAAKAFNDENLDLIRNKLMHMQALDTFECLKDRILLQMKKLLPKFCDVKAEEIRYQPGTAEMQQLDPTDEGDKKHKHHGAFVLQNGESEIKMKTRGIINDLGEIIEFDTSFKPGLNIFDEGDELSVYRVLHFECPGVAKEDILVGGRPNGVDVTITKPNPIDDGVREVEPLQISHGTWKRTFEWRPDDEYKWVYDPSQSSFDKGLLVLKLKKEALEAPSAFGLPYVNDYVHDFSFDNWKKAKRDLKGEESEAPLQSYTSCVYRDRS